jgi:hypothetical protein
MPESTLEKTLISAIEAAEMLSMSERTLRALSQPRGPIPCVRISSRLVRYSPRALMAWLVVEQQATSVDASLPGPVEAAKPREAVGGPN